MGCGASSPSGPDDGGRGLRPTPAVQDRAGDVGSQTRPPLVAAAAPTAGAASPAAAASEPVIPTAAKEAAPDAVERPALPDSVPTFPEPAPMMLMPYPIFKKQGRIMKSLKPWREEVRAEGRMVQFDPKTHKVIFVSHTVSSAQEPGSSVGCPSPCLEPGRLTLPCCARGR